MRRLSAAGFLLLLLVLASCKTAAPPPPRPTIPPEEREFLLNPTVAAPSVEPFLHARIEEAYRSFDQGRSPAEVEAVARKILEAAPGVPSALVLLAQTEYLTGQYQAVVERLRPLLAEQPAYVAAAVLAGRSYERLGDELAAFEAYRGVAELDQVAGARAAELRRKAVELMTAEARQAAGESRYEDAEAILARVDALSPGAKSSLEIRLEIHRGRNQVREELAVLRQLAPVAGSRPLRERLGQLEVDIGDVKAGLEVFEALLREQPGDAALLAQVDRAKFRWRLERLPARVRAIARKAELTRADLASLLYWLLPPVQHSPVVDPPIAGDILNHPAQQEILRVTDLGLMEVDETLHRFNPDGASNRRATLAALLALLARQRLPCVAGESLAKDARAWVCRKSVECGLLGDESRCQPGSPISGTDAVDLLKACLDRLGDS
jgi:tetratricopeptide (TPR) repeat protein